jgi:CRISPR system Cascade subunit CasE
MVYLSKLMIDPAMESVNRLYDLYRYHQLVWTAFPSAMDGQARDFLFRVDRSRDGVSVLLLSNTPPSATAVGGWSTKAVPESFYDHRRYRFSIRVNPTVRREGGGRKFGVGGETEIRAWMNRKGKMHGFRVVEAHVSNINSQRYAKPGVCHLSADIGGVIEVADKGLFFQAAMKGIGSAKGYGFGMLLLSPEL